MIFYRFNMVGPTYRLMIKWCEDSAADYKFVRNNQLITGVWLTSEDALLFRLKFASAGIF